MGFEHFDTVMSFVVIMLLLSMLITVLVQCVVALSGLRGWNLHFGVIQLLEQLDPGLEKHAKSVAKAILEHPSVAPMPVGKWGRRKATAIRPEELLHILRDLSQSSSELESSVKDALMAAVDKAGTPDPEDLGHRIDTAVGELKKMFPAQSEAVRDAVHRGLAKTSLLESHVKTWFNTVMDRTTERFVLYTRWITAFLAFALAIGLHVDSLQLFKQLSGSPELRAKLIQSADSTLQQAGVIAADRQKPKPLASEAIRAMASGLNNEDDRKLLVTVPDGLTTREEGRKWLDNTFTQPELSELLVAYDRQFEEETLNYLKELRVSFDDVKSSLNTAGIQLALPKTGGSGGAGWYLGPGVLMTGLFLSLGAPFWFNALRQLANLRPAIAGKVDKEAAQAAS
jgi:hypothetical protein